MNDDILHERDESPEPRFRPGKLISLLDIIGGGRAICDSCGRWQSVSALCEADARQILGKSGWTFRDGKDFCQVCSKAKSASKQEQT
jgi:hypothetical protein